MFFYAHLMLLFMLADWDLKFVNILAQLWEHWNKRLCWTANFTFRKFYNVWRIGTKTFWYFWKMWFLRMVNFANFGGLTPVLKFHIFLIFNCEELVFVSSAKDWFNFSQVWRIGTQFSQMWRSGTSSSQLKSVNNRVMLRSYVCCVLKVLIFVWNFLHIPWAFAVCIPSQISCNLHRGLK